LGPAVSAEKNVSATSKANRSPLLPSPDPDLEEASSGRELEENDQTQTSGHSPPDPPFYRVGADFYSVGVHFYTVGVEFSTVGVDFSRVGVDFSRVGVDFSRVGVDFSRVGVDFSRVGVDFSRVGVDFSRVGVDFSSVRVDFYTVGVDFYRIGVDFYGFGLPFYRIGARPEAVSRPFVTGGRSFSTKSAPGFIRRSRSAPRTLHPPSSTLHPPSSIPASPTPARLSHSRKSVSKRAQRHFFMEYRKGSDRALIVSFRCPIVDSFEFCGTRMS
jgi:hypothetical protein